MKKKNKNYKKNKKIIWQVLPVVFLVNIVVILSFRLGFYSSITTNIVDSQNELSQKVAGDIIDTLYYYWRDTDLEWLINYWTYNNDQMDVYYLNEFANTDEFYEKINAIYEEFENQPELQDVPYEELTDLQQKHLAEAYYMELEYYFDMYRSESSIKHVYMITRTAEDEITFIFSGALPTETRGEDDNQIFRIGKTEKLDLQKYHRMMEAFDTGEAQIANPKTFIYDSLFDTADIKYDIYIPLVLNGKTAAVVGVETEANALINTIHKDLIEAETIPFIISIISMIILTFLLLRYLLTPIVEVERSVKDFSEERDLEKLRSEMNHVKSRNEIGRLADNMSKLGGDLIRYVEEVTQMNIKENRIATELEMASNIQKSSLDVNFTDIPCEWNIDLFASMYPAKEVGGDFYSFIVLDDTHLALIVADVSEKGVPAALFMMKSKVMLENELTHTYNPAYVLDAVNKKLVPDNDQMMFVTVWLGILDVTTGIMKTANAGHEYPLIKHADGSAEYIRDAHGLVMGVLEDSKYVESEIQLRPGDVIIQYSDGITEAMDVNGKQFGDDNLLAVVNNVNISKPEAIINSVNSSVNSFSDGTEQFDDMTILAVKYK